MDGALSSLCWVVEMVTMLVILGTLCYWFVGVILVIVVKCHTMLLSVVKW